MRQIRAVLAVVLSPDEAKRVLSEEVYSRYVGDSSRGCLIIPRPLTIEQEDLDQRAVNVINTLRDGEIMDILPLDAPEARKFLTYDGLRLTNK